MYIATLIITAFICAGFAGYIAGQKGYSKSSWFFLGLLFNLFALISIAGLPKSKASTMTRKCDRCKLDIPFNAMMCPFCHMEYTSSDIISMINEKIGKNVPGDLIVPVADLLLDLNDLDTLPLLIKLISNYQVEERIKKHIIGMGKPAANILIDLKKVQTNYYQRVIDEIVAKIKDNN